MIADLALAMRRIVKEKFAGQSTSLSVRIGIHTGPVVAGVIGKNKFTYDLWGESVEITHKLEANCKPGEILASKAVFNKVRDLFIFRQGPTLSMEDGEEIETVFLEARKSLVEN